MQTKSYQTVKELLKDINRQGDKIAMLFGHRTSRVMRDDLLGLTDNDYEQYDQLLQTGFIRDDEQTGFYLDTQKGKGNFVSTFCKDLTGNCFYCILFTILGWN
jgi:hypothetical protein